MAALTFLLLLALPLQAARPQGPPRYHEAQIKAVLLFNFIRFVEWPTRAFASPEDPIIVGVLGEDPFGPVLDEAVRGEKAAGRPIVVARFRRLQELGPCHLLYIAPSERTTFSSALGRLRGSPVLTVGEMEGFVRRGGMIELSLRDGKVRFKINKTASDRAGLRVSSQLLKLAAAVR